MTIRRWSAAVTNALTMLEQAIEPGEVAIAEQRAERDAETFKDLVNIWIERWVKKNRKRWYGIEPITDQVVVLPHSVARLLPPYGSGP